MDVRSGWRQGGFQLPVGEGTSRRTGPGMRRSELPGGAIRSFNNRGGAAAGLVGHRGVRTARHPRANHGIWPPDDAPIDRMSDEQWHRTIAVNLDSVFSLVKHSVAQMKKQGGTPAGHIVLVSSTAGQRGEAYHCDYAATKGALISMVKGLSTELARDHIYINSVAA